MRTWVEAGDDEVIEELLLLALHSRHIAAAPGLDALLVLRGPTYDAYDCKISM